MDTYLRIVTYKTVGRGGWEAVAVACGGRLAGPAAGGRCVPHQPAHPPNRPPTHPPIDRPTHQPIDRPPRPASPQLPTHPPRLTTPSGCRSRAGCSSRGRRGKRRSTWRSPSALTSASTSRWVVEVPFPQAALDCLRLLCARVAVALICRKPLGSWACSPSALASASTSRWAPSLECAPGVGNPGPGPLRNAWWALLLLQPCVPHTCPVPARACRCWPRLARPTWSLRCPAAPRPSDPGRLPGLLRGPRGHRQGGAGAARPGQRPWARRKEG